MSAIPPSIRVDAQHLAEDEAVDLDGARRERDERREPLDRARDRVHAEPRPRRVGALAAEDERRVEVAEAAGLDRVVGRLEHDASAASSTSRRSREERGERALLGRQLLAREEQKADVDAQLGRVSAAQRASSSITASPPFMSLAPRPMHQPSSIRPGQVVLRRDGVEVAGEQDERPPGCAPSRRRSRLAVVERARLARGTAARDVLGERRLVPARRRDVDELERALRERGPRASAVTAASRADDAGIIPR